ncbi:MAG: 50S ribosomal protein L23 [bacterium]
MKQQKLKHKKVKLSPYEIILEPILTEKSIRLINSSKNKKYTFKVLPSASKVDIKEAVETIFGVKVQKVNTIKIPQKTKIYRYRYKFSRDAYKKAVVTLKEGYKIDSIDSSIEKEK